MVNGRRGWLRVPDFIRCLISVSSSWLIYSQLNELSCRKLAIILDCLNSLNSITDRCFDYSTTFIFYLQIQQKKNVEWKTPKVYLFKSRHWLRKVRYKEYVEWFLLLCLLEPSFYNIHFHAYSCVVFVLMIWRIKTNVLRNDNQLLVNYWKLAQLHWALKWKWRLSKLLKRAFFVFKLKEI